MTLPPDMAWMDWDGWRWIAPALAMGIGAYFGWDARGYRWRERAARDLVSKISTFTDPLKSLNVVDEIECWAEIVEEAKEIMGDNAPVQEDGPDAC